MVGYGQSWTCESWTGLCTSSRSRCKRKNAFSSASVPEIGLQRSTPDGHILSCLDLPQHRPFLRFAFEGRVYQCKFLPFGLSLSPCVFMKVTEVVIVPLRERGVRILNYLDDWLILAPSRDQLCEHRDMVLCHLTLLGLRVNWEKSKLRINLCRGLLFSVWIWTWSTRLRITEEHVQTVLTAGWATPNTFARFYSLCVETVSSHVLAPCGQ